MPDVRARWIGALALLAAVGAVAVVVVPSAVLDLSGPDPAWIALAAIVVVLAAAVAWRPARAPRFAWLYVVPAALSGWLWRTGLADPVGSRYVTVAWVGEPGEEPTPAEMLARAADSPSSFDPDRFTALAVPALVLLLLAIFALGLIVLVRDARPGTGAVQVLAVVAAVLVAPVWATTSIDRLQTPDSVAAASQLSSAGATAQALGLGLALVVGLAVVRSRERVPARASLYLLPAAALTWVAYLVRSGHRPTGIFLLGPGEAPSAITLLPWTIADLGLAALVATLWVLAVRGLHVALARYRPPTALEEPVRP